MDQLYFKKIDSNTIIVKPSLNSVRDSYVKLIKDANLLGEYDEVERLQNEWQKVKASYETE